jgi:hypothetical protein
MTDTPHPSEDDVLNDFLSETAQDRTALERYLRLYPAHAGALLDLYGTVTRQQQAADDESADLDEAWIAQSVARLRASFNAEAPADPFLCLSPIQFNAVKATLGMRSGTLTGFRDRLVDVATVPVRVLRDLAAALGTSLEGLTAFLAMPPRLAGAQSYRADGQPQAPSAKVSFEALMIAANETAETRARLLAEDA